MTKVLVAGATGYLGHYVVKEVHGRSCWVRVLARSEQKLAGLEDEIDDIFVGHVTKPESIMGVADGIDTIISSIGITRQKDKLTYQEVDYQGNLNLLKDALKHGVKKFVYVSVLNAHEMLTLQIVQAKERFVNDLKKSGIDYTVIRPNGFFSDMVAFLQMAAKGRVFLLGDGHYRINPIHGRDLAEVCANAIETNEKEIEVGGPSIYTHQQIAEAAFHAVGKEPKISRVPTFVAKGLILVLRLFASSKIYGPLEFAITVSTRDMIGPKYGRENLTDFFREEAKRACP